MSNSLQSLTLSSLGALGSVIASGTGVFVNPNGWVGFRSLDDSFTLSEITAPPVSGVSYLVGKSISPPFEFLAGKITSVQLSTGAIQLFY